MPALLLLNDKACDGLGQFYPITQLTQKGDVPYVAQKGRSEDFVVALVESFFPFFCRCC